MLVLGSASAATIYTWESGLEGWSGGNISTTTTGATNGSQALRIDTPMSSMWYSTAASLGLDATSRQTIFNGATMLTLDVSYPNPGYNSWWAGPTVSLVIQGDGVGWTELGDQALTLDAAPQTFSWALNPVQAASLANGSWGQVLILFKYGNGGSTGPDATFFVDNFTSNAVPEPSSAMAVLTAGLMAFRRRRF
jgi:hypothetical protein